MSFPAKQWKSLPFTRYRRDSSSKLRPGDRVVVPPFLLGILGAPTPEHLAHVLPLMMLVALTRGPMVPVALFSAQLRPL